MTSPGAARARAAGGAGNFRLIAPRRRVRAASGLLLAAAFALAFVPVATAERWLFPRGVVAGEPAPYTVRLPGGGGGGLVPGVPAPGRIVVARGEPVTAAQAALAPPGAGGSLGGLATTFALTALLLSAYLGTTQRGRLLVVQAAALGAVLVVGVAAKALLLFTPLSTFLLPVGALALILAATVDRSAGVGTAVAAGLVVATLVPFDAPVGLVLGTQGLAATLALGSGRKRRDFLQAGALAGAAAAGCYVGVHYLYTQSLPWGELSAPARSPLCAALAGGLLAGPVAVTLRPLVERATGQIPKARLVELADLQNPLLRQIATQSPGTWQHSLAMANMAEVAANAIGANALLTRVGAYYHDLGKSLQPAYYIENLTPDQPSPHDRLAPEVSADAIFSHVTEGVRLARSHGLPEAVIDFMHMHHGDGLLEYFWSKCQESGNPRGLSERDFRYPGVPPQTRETALLCIVDAVEAASRTLKHPDGKAIEALVQRIVYGKLHRGQLDESGLSVADLKVLAATLVDTLKAAHHVRIEYPWQREERAAAGGGPRPSDQNTVPGTPESRQAAAPTQSLAAPPPASGGRVSTEILVGQHALDSADAPRPLREEAALVHEAREAKAAAATVDVTAPGARKAGAANIGAPAADPALAATITAGDVDEVKTPVRARPTGPPRTEKTPAVAEPPPDVVPEHERASTDPVVPIDGDDGEQVVAVVVAESDPLPAPPPPLKRTVEIVVPGSEPEKPKAAAEPAESDLTPGTLVLGAPPATKPKAAEAERAAEAADSDDGPTVTRAIPSPSQPPPRRRTRTPIPR